MNFIIVGFAGFLGAVVRYCLYLLQPRIYSGNFPLATLFINLSGCLIAGMLLSLATRSGPEYKQYITLILVGFVGSYTTFSTFGAESLHLIEANYLGQAILNISLNVFGGILMVWLGKTLINS